MELHPLIEIEWRTDHAFTPRSLRWIAEHADPDDPDPVRTAIAQLRADRIDQL